MLLADERMGDGAGFDDAVEHRLLLDALHQTDRGFRRQMDGVRVVGDVFVRALHDILRLRMEEAQVGLGQTARRAFRRAFLQRELQIVLLRVFLRAQIHVGDDLQTDLEDFLVLMQFFAVQELACVVQADDADDVRRLVQFDVGAAVAGHAADLPQRAAGAGQHFGDLRLLLQVGLYGDVHRRVDLLQQAFVGLHAAAGGAEGRLRDVDRDILETAETHAFRMAQHAVVVDRRAQTAAGRQRDFVAVEDEIGGAVLGGQLAGFLIDFVLVGIGERLGADVEVAFREFEHAAAAVAFAPHLQQGGREGLRLLDVVAIDHDVLAVVFQRLLDDGIVVQAELLLILFGEDEAGFAVLLREEVHQMVAVVVRVVAELFLQRNDRAVRLAEHVAAARADGGNGLQIGRDARVDVEIQKQRLAAAGERVLRTVENQFLRHLVHLLFVHADQIRRVEDVDVRDAQRARVVCLHGREERVQMARQDGRAARGIRFRVQIRQIAQTIFLDVFNGMGGAIDAVRIAQIVQMDGARVMSVLHIRREDRLKAPLLQDQFRDAQIHRLRIVRDDVAVFLRFLVHQVFDELARNMVQ